MKEIRNQLILAQVYNIQKESSKWQHKFDIEDFKKQYANNWKMLFKLANHNDLEIQLTPEILSNPSHNLVKLLLNIQTMDSFIYSDINIAARSKDYSKTKFYGAFAAALSYILYTANANRTDLKAARATKLWHGTKMGETEVFEYIPGKKIVLPGYISTRKEI